MNKTNEVDKIGNFLYFLRVDGSSVFVPIKQKTHAKHAKFQARQVWILENNLVRKTENQTNCNTSKAKQRCWKLPYARWTQDHQLGACLNVRGVDSFCLKGPPNALLWCMLYLKCMKSTWLLWQSRWAIKLLRCLIEKCTIHYWDGMYRQRTLPERQ